MSDAERQQDDYYSVLALERPGSKKATTIPKEKLKAAYQQALLLHHPDRMNSARYNDGQTQPQNGSSHYSIDQIISAYETLSDPVKKSAYDDTLFGREAIRLKSGTGHGAESYDLDDLDFDESTRMWYKGCRCGNVKGYSISETQLEEASSNGEIYVGCADCSLFIRVSFQAV